MDNNSENSDRYLNMHKEEVTTSQPEIDLDINKLIVLAKALITDLIGEEGHECVSMFNSQEVPTIKLDSYLKRIHRFTKFSPSCLIIAILYLDRYNLLEKDFCLNWFNVHRVFLTCLTLAVKFNDDFYYDNLAFERGGGVPIAQLIVFEAEIFEKLDFNLFVSKTEFQDLLEKLHSVYGDDSQQ